MKIIVVGAGGQLGAAVVRECTGAGDEVLALGRAELDVTDHDRIMTLVGQLPDVVINCTAYNAVDAAEDQPATAMAVNAHSVGALADMAESAGAVFVHFSSDFVFDGESELPYTEEDRPHPISQYGRSKAAGEPCAARASRHYILRLSSVFGGSLGEGRGGNTTIDRMIALTHAGSEVVAFVDRTVTPSYTRDVAWATRQLVSRGAPPGTYHCVSSEPTTWAELAHEVAGTLGVPPRVRPVQSSTVVQAARRPRRCALSNAKLAGLGIIMPTWRDALSRHMKRTS